jgi:fluoroquinolone transport system permease protein
MARVVSLLIGEVRRLWRYKIIFFGTLVTAIWLVIMALVSREEALALVPQLLVLDSGLMAIILLGSSYFLEKQEGTIKALLVTPIPTRTILFTKILGTMVGGVISVVSMTLLLGLLHDIWLPIVSLTLIMILSTFAHVSIGFVMIFLSKDFMDLLVKYSVIAIMLMVPTLLQALDILTSEIQFIGFISPTYAASWLFQSLWINQPLTETILAIGCLSLLPLGLLPSYILPHFKLEALSV